METTDKPSVTKRPKISIQEYFSLGYIYLLILGIASDLIYYGLLGINILSYSTISDVLLSPISLLGEGLTVPITLLVMLLFFHLANKFGPKFHEKNKHKKWYRKINNVEKLDKQYQSKTGVDEIIKALAVIILFLFLGLRLGMGIKVQGKMANNNLKLKNIIEFTDGQQQKIALLGQNSLYLFYVEEGETNLTISPIAENIKKITSREVKETEVGNN